MAVTQKSKIQVRRGRRENLPQLAAGELGWAIDTQQLYIGNGTFTDGAPAEGNTEILTEVSLQSSGFIVETLNNDVTTPTEFYRFNSSAFPAGVINYSLLRGSVYRVGTIQYAVNQQLNTISITDITTGGPLGITFSAVLSGVNAIFRYTASNTGDTAIIKYKRVDFQ
jgi:hypothetical protein